MTDMQLSDVLLLAITTLLGMIAYFMGRMVKQFDRLELDVRSIQKSFDRFRMRLAKALDMDWITDDDPPTPSPVRSPRKR